MHPRDEQKLYCEKWHWEIARALAARQRVCSLSRKEERLYAREERKARRHH
jgi:hypothetical protein